MYRVQRQISRNDVFLSIPTGFLYSHSFVFSYDALLEVNAFRFFEIQVQSDNSISKSDKLTISKSKTCLNPKSYKSPSANGKIDLLRAKNSSIILPLCFIYYNVHLLLVSFIVERIEDFCYPKPFQNFHCVTQSNPYPVVLSKYMIQSGLYSVKTLIKHLNAVINEGWISITDEQTVKFFSPSPILIWKNLIRSSPDPHNFWKSSIWCSPDPCKIMHCYFASWCKNTAGVILRTAKHDWLKAK